MTCTYTSLWHHIFVLLTIDSGSHILVPQVQNKYFPHKFTKTYIFKTSTLCQIQLDGILSKSQYKFSARVKNPWIQFYLWHIDHSIRCTIINSMWQLETHSKNIFLWTIVDHFFADKCVQGNRNRVLPLCQPFTFMKFLHFISTNQTFELSINLLLKFWWHFHFSHIE